MIADVPKTSAIGKIENVVTVYGRFRSWWVFPGPSLRTPQGWVLQIGTVVSSDQGDLVVVVKPSDLGQEFLDLIGFFHADTVG